MTSTNINIGIEGRTSSRVLKPPGGAHTDIFGSTQDRMEVTTSRFSKQSQKSSISECFLYSGSPPVHKPKQEVVQESVQESIETVKAEVNGLKNGSITEDENTKPVANVPPVPQRVRVPPGGFSSGLW